MDRKLEAALERMRRAGARADVRGACLGAEALAAWADGTLPPRERTLAEAHAADCPRCLAVMAAIVRTAPARPSGRAPWWRAPWRVRWVVPMAAAATALVLWVYVGTGPRPPSAPAPQPASERTSRAASEAAPLASPSIPPARQTSQAVPDMARSAPATPPPAVEGTTKDQGERRRQAAISPPAAAPRPTAKAPAPAEAATSARPADDLEARPSAPGAPVAVTTQAPPPVDPRAEARSVETETPRARRESVAARLQERPRAIAVVSPVPAARWRLDGASIDRSIDGGVTWTRQLTAAAPLLAGHAPAADVCWMVGSQGLVLLSRDGRTWARAAPPAAVDLIGVRAVDGRTASVTAADGRVFRTSDGGQSWFLQENQRSPF